MKVKLQVANGVVFWKPLFKKVEVVGMMLEGILSLNKEFHDKLEKNDADVQIKYRHIAPRKSFRRRF